MLRYLQSALQAPLHRADWFHSKRACARSSYAKSPRFSSHDTADSADEPSFFNNQLDWEIGSDEEGEEYGTGFSLLARGESPGVSRAGFTRKIIRLFVALKVCCWKKPLLSFLKAEYLSL